MMLYVTGCNGLIGSRFLEMYEGPVTKITYRDEVTDVFESHEDSCLLHFAWSSTTRDTYDSLDRIIKSDVINSQKLFNFYSKKNPNGKIIFISSAGGLHTSENRTVTECFTPTPQTLYGECKLQVENILKTMDCNSTSLRVSNVWGGKQIKKNRINGLVDKLITNLDTNNIIEIYANLDTRVDIIHVDDLIELILKVIKYNSQIKHETYLVGAQSITIKDIISKVSSNGSLLIKFTNKQEKTYLHIENSKVSKTFEWRPKILLV